MPRSTFCRLAPEKQERLLEAATREFSRRSFAEASINQIIKDAGIPRGSFYMYFDDKEDLFCYVMSGYVDQLLMVVRESVLRAGGDLFQGMLDLYDFLLRQGRGQEPGDMGAMAAILACNSGLQKNMLLGLLDREAVLDGLGDAGDRAMLDLRHDRDLGDILAAVLTVAAPLLYSGLQGDSRGAVRERLENVLMLMKHGMVRDKGTLEERK